MSVKVIFLLAIFGCVQLMSASSFRSGYGFDRIGRKASDQVSSNEHLLKLNRLNRQPPLFANKPQPDGTIRVRRLNNKLNGLNDNITSYSIFVATNRSCNANLFGWFFQNPVSIPTQIKSVIMIINGFKQFLITISSKLLRIQKRLSCCGCRVVLVVLPCLAFLSRMVHGQSLRS